MGTSAPQKLGSIGAVEEFIRDGRFRYVLEPIRSTGRHQSLRWVDWITRPAVDASMDTRVFIEAVESLGLCHVLDWRSATDAINWLATHPELDRLSIRISAASLAEPELARQLVSLMERREVDPTRLCYNIAVHSALSDLGGATRFVKAMRRVGSLITLCDGIPGNPVLGLYGPLGFVNHLRIDRRWIREAPDCRSHRETLESIVDYAKRLDLEVIADGVDTRPQFEIVSCMGVDHYAGNYETARPGVAECDGQDKPFVIAGTGAA